jgi:hypothetical protein
VGDGAGHDLVVVALLGQDDEGDWHLGAGSGTPTTAAAVTPGNASRTRSTSEAATFSPPTLSMSLARSTKRMLPAAETATRSPVQK